MRFAEALGCDLYFVLVLEGSHFENQAVFGTYNKARHLSFMVRQIEVEFINSVSIKESSSSVSPADDNRGLLSRYVAPLQHLVKRPKGDRALQGVSHVQYHFAECAQDLHTDLLF